MHYDKEYFNWQKEIGEFGGEVNAFLFSNYIKPTDCVIDFGCGGGYILSNVNCSQKIGIEINEHARMEAMERGVTVVSSAEEIQDSWADVIISNHALEHAHHPLEELKRLHSKLKPGGKIIFVVPHELNNKFNPGDHNQHLYTWSPMNAGNLFALAGYQVLESHSIKHLWSMRYKKIRDYLGHSVFNLICRIHGTVSPRLRQTRVVATKKG